MWESHVCARIQETEWKFVEILGNYSTSYIGEMPHLENSNIHFCFKMSGNLRHIDARQPAQCFRDTDSQL